MGFLAVGADMQEATRTKATLVTILSVEEEADLWSRGGLSGGCFGSGRGLVPGANVQSEDLWYSLRQ